MSLVLLIIFSSTRWSRRCPISMIGSHSITYSTYLPARILCSVNTQAIRRRLQTTEPRSNTWLMTWRSPSSSILPRSSMATSQDRKEGKSYHHGSRAPECIRNKPTHTRTSSRIHVWSSSRHSTMKNTLKLSSKTSFSKQASPRSERPFVAMLSEQSQKIFIVAAFYKLIS